MYDVKNIIDLVNTKTPYTCDYLKAKQPTIVEYNNLPFVGVGFYDINSPSPTTPVGEEVYQMFAENLVQGFDVQTICEQKDLVVIWRTLYKALVGTNEQPLEEQFSGLTYGTGGVIGLENGRICWLDRWRIDFPTMNII